MFSGDNEELVKENIKSCYNKIVAIKDQYKSDFIYLDAMKSPVSKIKQKFRYQILMRVLNENIENITELVYNACDEKSPRVSCFVETNPQSLS